MVLEREIEKWKGFKNALRSDDKEAFEELMNQLSLERADMENPSC